ncbi:DUF6745 domain-containing protein [Phormidium nigroviride]
MTAKYIEKLTPEQLALIPIIRDEWIKIALDTTPIDKQKAEAAICLAYECAELEPPKEILWFDNPLDVANYVPSTCVVADAVRVGVIESLKDNIRDTFGDFIDALVCDTVWQIVGDTVENTFGDPIIEALWDVEDLKINAHFPDCIMQAEWFAYFAYFEALGFDCSKAKGLFATAKHCGWWWAFKDVAVAIPKPSAIRLDERGRLHGEGVPAVAYQGFNVYAYHGVRLPEKYGSIHPEKWQSQWLLEEDNAELKRVLIQGIGYDRICQELQAIELDSLQEYTLLRIDSNIDIEPIYLLKMTCPSTGYIHALRVPPDMATARDAITWVNWGIAPEEFAVQT